MHVASVTQGQHHFDCEACLWVQSSGVTRACESKAGLQNCCAEVLMLSDEYSSTGSCMPAMMHERGPIVMWLLRPG